MKFNWKALYAHLIQTCIAQGITVSRRSLAKEGGFTASIFTRLKSGKAISVVNLLKVLKVLNIPVSDLARFAKFKQK
jgi:DNA-binding Xre family transcriptional regulator